MIHMIAHNPQESKHCCCCCVHTLFEYYTVPVISVTNTKCKLLLYVSAVLELLDVQQYVYTAVYDSRNFSTAVYYVHIYVMYFVRTTPPFCCTAAVLLYSYYVVT